MPDRLSDEARRELAKMTASLTAITATPKPTTYVAAKAPPVRARRVTRAPKKPEPSLTEYIRATYPEDQALQSFADMIDMNPGVWRLMGQLYNLGIKAGSGLRNWDVNRRAEARSPMITTIQVEIVDLEGTKIVRDH